MDFICKKRFNYLFIAIFIASVILGTFAYSNLVQKSISEKVIRFHVVANSNSEFDQKLKLKVRDKVLETISNDISKAQNTDDARKILSENFIEIQKVSKDVIEAYGMDYDVNVKISEEKFPFKNYGIINFPAGNYKALKIEIGKACGENWWCVVFPPLCLTDETLSNEGKDILKESLTDEEIDIVMESGENGKVSAKFKLFIVEKWQELIN